MNSYEIENTNPDLILVRTTRLRSALDEWAREGCVMSNVDAAEFIMGIRNRLWTGHPPLTAFTREECQKLVEQGVVFDGESIGDPELHPDACVLPNLARFGRGVSDAQA